MLATGLDRSEFPTVVAYKNPTPLLFLIASVEFETPDYWGFYLENLERMLTLFPSRIKICNERKQT